MTKGKLNILVVFNSLMGVVGGGSRHILYVADHWCAAHTVHFLISESGYKAAKMLIWRNPSPNKKVFVYSTPFDNSRNRYLNYFSRTFKSIIEIRKLRKKNEYDVVIAPNYLPQNMIPCIFIKRNAKLVVYFHTVPPSVRREVLRRMNFLRRAISMMNWKLCVFLARSFDLIFVVNEATRSYFIKKGFAPEKIIVVGNGIPYAEIENAEIEGKEYEGVFLGRLVWNKGIYDLVDIWKIVVERKPSAKLCIIGDGSERDKLEKKIEKEGLRENIIIAGWKEGKEKYKLMNKSRVFVYPSYYESWGVVIAEAMACALPVVAYHLPIYEEVFGEHIFTVEVGNYKKIAEKVLDILKDSQDYKEMIENAKNFVARYSWKEVAEHQLRNIVDIVESI